MSGFTPVPNEVFVAWQKRDVNYRQVALYGALMFKAWQQYGDATFTLAQLKAELDLDVSSDTLTRDLRVLERWFEVVSPPPGDRRNPTWKVYLRTDTPLDAELDNDRAEVGEASERHGEAGNTLPTKGGLGATTETDSDTTVKTSALLRSVESLRDERAVGNDSFSAPDFGNLDPYGDMYGVVARVHSERAIDRLLEVLTDADKNTRKTLANLRCPAEWYDEARKIVLRREDVASRSAYAVTVLKNWKTDRRNWKTDRR